MNVRRKQRKVRIVAAVEREFDNLLCIDHLAVFARIGLEHFGRALNRLQTVIWRRLAL